MSELISDVMAMFHSSQVHIRGQATPPSVLWTTRNRQNKYNLGLCQGAVHTSAVQLNGA